MAGTAEVQVKKLNEADPKRYVRVVGTVGGGTPSFDYGVEFLGIRQR